MPDKSVCFLINNEKVTLNNLNPNTTVLQYLREQRTRLGSKEGCASGDCGACTVVIGEVVEAKMQYRSVNACITLIVSLHGKQLITVEDLKQKNALHPTQQSMVDCHSSQCGFCTPGIVMSFFALHKKHATPNRQQVLEALSGNLCRCTGYRSIIEAGLKSSDSQNMSDSFEQASPQTIEHLQALQDKQTVSLEHDQSRAFYPQSIEQLTKLLEQYPDACLLAGGTDLTLEITQNLHNFKILICILGVKELSKIEESEDQIIIGAAARYTSFIQVLAKQYPEWGEMIERLGSLQIRNLGTLGGNIANASPIGDMPPVLIALDAKLTLRRGLKTRQIAAEDFFVDYKVTALQAAEFIESVSIPTAHDQRTLKVYKVSKRFDDDISAVLAAFNIQVLDNKVVHISIAFGGMAATPKRASHCEEALHNQAWNESSIRRAMKALESDFTPLSDARASSTYRMQLAKNLLRRAFIETNTTDVLTQVFEHA